MTKVYLVAAEPSGDLLASEIAIQLRAHAQAIELYAIGGQELASVGLSSPIDISELSVVGLFEGLKIYRRVVELADAAADDIINKAPDVVALVDSWGFTLRVAKRVRARAPHIKLVKVVGPQVWATRPGRARTLAGTVDHLVCIHPFETPYYEPYGLKVTVMGNPALSRGQDGNAERGRRALGIAGEAEMLLVLPGSRRGEIEHVAPILIEAAEQVKRQRPEVKIVVHPASNVRQLLLERFPEGSSSFQLSPADASRYDIMAAADYALACSGTVTSELAMQSTPFLVGYHTGWITWALARYFLFKPTHITLLNIAAGDVEIVPEFVQTKFTSGSMAAEALKMLSGEAARSEQVASQKKALALMGEGNSHAADIAARAILESV